MPSVVVTFQYSLSLSPLPRLTSVSFSTLVPSSFFSFHTPGVGDSISSPACPLRERVALLEYQHWSPVWCDGLSSAHEAYLRSMKPDQPSQPSPIHPP